MTLKPVIYSRIKESLFHQWYLGKLDSYMQERTELDTTEAT